MENGKTLVNNSAFYEKKNQEKICRVRKNV